MKALMLSLAIAAGAALVAAPAAMRPAGHVAAASVQEPDGRALYLKNCRQCHGATGEPSAQSKHKYPKIKTLRDPAFLAARSDDSLVTVIKKGAGKDMKSLANKLTPEQMVAVAKYVRTLPNSH